MKLTIDIPDEACAVTLKEAAKFGRLVASVPAAPRSKSLGRWAMSAKRGRASVVVTVRRAN